MDFEFATAQRIVFGPGRLRELPALAESLGSRVALVTGAGTDRAAPVIDLLETRGIRPALFHVAGEPTTEEIMDITNQARSLGCDWVAAVGGGSAIDAGKAVSALLTNTRDLTDYLEVIGRGEPLENDPAPCIAIPTTAGTGAEVTRNAVLLSPEHKVKVSMRHPKMLPTVALVDPELTCSMPPSVTASTGLDAFTQLLEAFVSIKANPLTDALCREGLRQVARALPVAYEDGADLEARTAMALGSLFGGLALANAGLGAVHGFAGPLGGMFKAPHGMVCAALLPAVCQANILALQDRAPDHPALAKYLEVIRIITGNPAAGLTDGVNWIEETCVRLKVPGLAAFGVGEAHFPDLISSARKASSMKGNPIQLTDQELTTILQTSL